LIFYRGDLLENSVSQRERAKVAEASYAARPYALGALPPKDPITPPKGVLDQQQHTKLPNVVTPDAPSEKKALLFNKADSPV